MTDAVETMAYVGQTPWHGLGNRVEDGIDLDDFRREAGLDWEVQKSPVFYEDGVSFKDRFVLNRTSDRYPFAVVSSRYKPVQPKEIFEFFRDLLAQHGMKMHTAGSLMNGGRIWALAQTGDSAFIRGSDRVDSYLLLSTSYDLTLSTLAQFTSVRVVCNNTLQQALEESDGRVTVPHTTDFDQEFIKEALGISKEQWSIFSGALRVLAHIDMDAPKAREVLSKVFDLPEDPTKPHPNRKHVEIIVNTFAAQAFKGSDLAGYTAWGLLNGVTEYIDHWKRARNQGNRLNSAWFGEGAEYKKRTLNELLKLI